MKILIEEDDELHEVEVAELNYAHGANMPGKQVLKSAAGFYIGWLSLADWYDGPGEFWEPYARDSQYYWGTRAEAEDALRNNTYAVKF